MINYIPFFLIIFSLLFSLKYYFILNDQKINRQKINQYQKKKKIYFRRGRIFDKNKKIIQYSTYQYNKKKEIIYKRKYLAPCTTTITGMTNFENQGISGLEQYYQKNLEKKTSISYFSKLFLGDTFIKTNQPLNGQDLYTTIDTELTDYCAQITQDHNEKWKSQFTTLVIMDGMTGAVESLVQYPYYIHNQNNIDYLYPLAINNSYEMGSILKIFLMAAALQEKLVNKNSLVNCYGVKKKKIQGIPLTTWKAHGIIPFYQVIKESNNFGVGQIGLILGKKLYAYYDSFGFGKPLPIPFIGQSTGFLSNPETWSKRTPLSLSFGYEMRCSLLQLMSAITIFIHDGKRIMPIFLQNQSPQLENTLCGIKASQEGKSIIWIENKKLINFGLSIPPECMLFGKTGTANILIDGAYDPTKNTYVFVGFIEYKGETKVIGLYTYLSNKSNIYSSQVSLPTICKIIQNLCNQIDKKNKIL